MAEAIDATVPLDKPIEGHGGKMHSTVSLRKPRPREYLRHGEPTSYARTAEKVTVAAENDAAIAAYIELCIVEPEPAIVLAACTLADTMRIKDAVLDFFYKARTSS